MSQYVIQSMSALKSCLSGMVSINKEIVECAEKSTAAILDLDEPQKWWPEVEAVLMKGRSVNQRINLLKIVASHGDEIPLAPICRLLKDPNIRVQRAAIAVLDSVDPYRVKEAMKRAKEQQENEEMGRNKVIEPEPIPCVRERPVRHRPTSFIQPIEMSMEVIADLSDFVSSSEEEAQPEQEKQAFGRAGNAKPGLFLAVPEPRVAPTYTREPQTAPKLEQRKPKPEAKREAEKAEQKERQPVIRARRDPSECIGVLPTRRSTKVFKLRDLSTRSWEERKKFLEELNQLLTEGTLTMPPEQILDSAMTCATPVYSRVVPILCTVLSNLIVSDPQILAPFIDEILQFVLLAFRQTGRAGEIETLIEVLYLEADPNEVVRVCVNEAKKETRPLHIETCMLKWFAIDSAIELERPVYLDFMSYLAYNAYPEAKKLKTSMPRYMSNVNQVLTVVSRNQQQLFIEFTLSQPAHVQTILEKYIRNEISSKQTSNPEEESIPEIENPIATIRSEFRKRNKAHMTLLAHAFAQVEVHSTDHLKSIFSDLLLFLSQLPEDLIQQETDNIRAICGSVFIDPELIKRKFEQDLIPGLAVFVWNCPKEALAGSDRLYPELYALFKKAPGVIRTRIVVVTLAIAKATGKAFKEMNAIHPAHKKLIEKIETQFM